MLLSNILLLTMIANKYRSLGFIVDILLLFGVQLLFYVSMNNKFCLYHLVNDLYTFYYFLKSKLSLIIYLWRNCCSFAEFWTSFKKPCFKKYYGLFNWRSFCRRGGIIGSLIRTRWGTSCWWDCYSRPGWIFDQGISLVEYDDSFPKAMFNRFCYKLHND